MNTSPKPKTFNFGDFEGYTRDEQLPDPASEHTSVTVPPVKPYVPDLPHFGHINRIPIADVATKLGWQVTGTAEARKITCPKSNDHSTRTLPFLRILQSSNKVVCDACDTYPMTVLDMVKCFGRFETLRDAAECVAAYYPDMPRKAKASYLNNPRGEPVPPGCVNPNSLLVTSGIWGELSTPSQKLIPVLLAFYKQDSAAPFPLSQRAMMQYSGIGSFTGISEALTELKAVGFLERLPVRRRERSPEKETARFCVTPLSQRLRDFADITAQRFGATIFQEKAIAREKRRQRNLKWMLSPSDEM